MASEPGAVCHYCGREVTYGGPIGLQPSVDHVVPACDGGPDSDDNFVLACRACNSAKGSKTAEDARHFIALVALGWPKFKTDQIEWLRSRGFDVSDYDNFKLWYERQ
jgi:5-methylcytosine-specific restriction endonuclease McrA